MATNPAPRSSGFWPMVIAFTLLVVLGAWWYATSGAEDDGVGRDSEPRTGVEALPGGAPGVTDPTTTAPQPLPGSPAATGTAGVPSGTAGAAPQPGDPTAESAGGTAGAATGGTAAGTTGTTN